MKMKKLAVLFAAAALTTVTAAGCSGGQKENVSDTAKEPEKVTAAEQTEEVEEKAPETTAEAAEADAEAAAGSDGENYDTGDASKDNARNQDGIGENELLVVSFGTSYNDSRRLTIGAIEDAVEKAFPDFAVRRGFTSQIIIDHVKSRDNIAIDNVGEALERAEKNGVRNLVIQPTHLMNGLEYTDLVNEAAEYSDALRRTCNLLSTSPGHLSRTSRLINSSFSGRPVHIVVIPNANCRSSSIFQFMRGHIQKIPSQTVCTPVTWFIGKHASHNITPFSFHVPEDSLLCTCPLSDETGNIPAL